MKLVIVESPSKAKTIEKYLGKNYTVTASVGHIRDLPKSNKDALDIEDGFKPHYINSVGKEDVIENIKSKAKKATEIILATDPDREGEAIAWHILEAAELDKKKTKRVTFNEITEEAVLEAMAHPRQIDMDLKEAQEARRVLDRLVGYDLSGIIWKKVRYGLSAGRVQSPALRILAEREREILAFKPEKYWTLEADLKKSKTTFTAVSPTEPTDQKEVDKITTYANKEAWFVKNITETKVSRKPLAPFRTSTLQQTASSRLGFTPRRTMQTAQKLYEKGFITYMRTDSVNLGASALKQAASTISKEFGKKNHMQRSYGKASKNAQEAHEAIRPTKFDKESAGFNEDQKKLYALIRARTLASQMVDAEILRQKLIVNCGDGETIPDFNVNASKTLSPGWLLADPRAKGDDQELPEVRKGDALDLKEFRPIEKETLPPPRYSEAGLIKELEKRGIGRPSTYASIIQTLYNRQYVDRESRSLKPTDTGMVVSGFLEEHFANYISDSFTSEMEDKLDKIAEGAATYEKTLSAFYKPFLKDVKSKEDLEKVTNIGPVPKEFKCPKCKKKMVFKLGKAGVFMSCATFPDCDGARSKDGTEIEDDVPLGNDPETGLPVFVLNGPYGPYAQLGDKKSLEENPGILKDKNGRKRTKPKRSAVPTGTDITTVSFEEAQKFLSLPKVLGKHPETEADVTANIGRFGPYIVHDGDFRSLKTDDVYNIELDRALEILSEPKKTRAQALAESRERRAAAKNATPKNKTTKKKVVKKKISK